VSAQCKRPERCNSLRKLQFVPSTTSSEGFHLGWINHRPATSVFSLHHNRLWQRSLGHLQTESEKFVIILGKAILAL